MARLNILSFGTGDGSEAGFSSGTISYVTSPIRYSRYSFRCNPTTTGTGLYRVQALTSNGAAVAANNATVYVSFYFRYAVKPAANSEIFAEFQSSSARKFSLRLTSTGVIAGYNSANTLVVTGTTVLAQDTWYRIDASCGTSATVGAYEVKIDDVSEFSGTTNTSASNNAYFFLGKYANSNSQTVDFYYSDFVWDSAAFRAAGNYAVTMLYPVADGHYQGWSIGAGGGSHWENVEETPPDGGTTYLLSATGAAVDETEALTDASTAGISGTVECVKSIAIVRLDSGSPTCRVLLRSGTTDDVTASNYLPTTSYVAICKLYATDPATSAGWLSSAIDGIEAGSRGTHVTVSTRLTFAAATIEFSPAVVTGKPTYYYSMTSAGLNG